MITAFTDSVSETMVEPGNDDGYHIMQGATQSRL